MKGHMTLLIAVCTVNFFSAFMGSGLNIALPFIAADYNTAPEDAAWLITSFAVTSAAFLPASGALADRLGYMSVFRAGCAGTALLSFATALMPVLTGGVLLRALQGVMISLLFCTSMALVADRIPKEHRAFAVGYSGSSVYAGLSFSPVISGFITETLGWEYIFHITGVFLIFALLLSFKESKDPPRTEYLPKKRISISFLSFSCAMLSLSLISTDKAAYITLIIGIIAVFFYLRSEYKSEHALIPVSYISQNKVMQYALGSSVFHYMGSFSYILLSAMLLQIILHYPAYKAGLIISLQPLLMTLISGNTGRLSAKFPIELMTVTGVFLCLASVSVLLFADLESSVLPVIISQILMGTGFGLFSSPNTVTVINAADKDRYAAVSSAQALSRTVGQGASMAVLTAVMHFMLLAHPDSAEYADELCVMLKTAFAISACAFIIALIFAVKCRSIIVKSKE